jgi:hypothetical protein
MPLPPSEANSGYGISVTAAASQVFGFVLMMVIGMVVGAFTNFLIRERRDKVRHMQVSSNFLKLIEFNVMNVRKRGMFSANPVRKESSGPGSGRFSENIECNTSKLSICGTTYLIGQSM